MCGVVQKNVQIHDVLPGADQDVPGRHFREILHEAFCPGAHAGRRNARHEEDLRDGGKLSDEFLCPFEHRLMSNEIRRGEEGDALVGNITLKTPGPDVVHIQFRNVAVFPFQKIKRIGIAFVQDVVHVQADPKTIFSHGIPAFKTMDLYWIITSLYHIVAPVGNPNEQRIELRNCRMKGCQKQGRML